MTLATSLKFGTLMSKSNWTLLLPVHNLEISSDIGGEIKIENILFISAKKITRVRKRLGINKPISFYQNVFRTPLPKKQFLKSAKVYAVIRTTREADDNLTKEFKRFKDAIYLLATSQFFRHRRNQRILFGSPEYANILIDDYYLFDCKSEKSNWNSLRIDPLQPYLLDKQWKDFMKNHFFPNMLKVINSQTQVTNRWQYIIRKASILAGQSHFARNNWEAFLYNIIALELLLTNRGEDIKAKLTERLIALFGWITNEDSAVWEKLIDKIYGLRSDFVHKGSFEAITIQDVVTSDTLLYNLLYNICCQTKFIKSKNDIIALSDRLNARKTLGLPYIDRPKKLRYTRHSTTIREFKKIENLRHWQW